jgi:hypothetical protein
VGAKQHYRGEIDHPDFGNLKLGNPRRLHGELIPHQFRTRNNLIETQRTRSESNENTANQQS